MWSPTMTKAAAGPVDCFGPGAARPHPLLLSQRWHTCLAGRGPGSLDRITHTDPERLRSEIRHSDVAIDRHEIAERLGEPGFAIWDARSRDEYLGHKGNNQRLGHIPGAVNLDWTDAMDKERQLRIRDYAELITELEALGLTPDMEIATHCQSHHRSGFTWLVGKALGSGCAATPAPGRNGATVTIRRSKNKRQDAATPLEDGRPALRALKREENQVAVFLLHSSR